MILTRKNWQALCKKNLIWNHVNNSRDNCFASSRDVKADMIRKFYSEMVRQCKIFYIFIFYIYNSLSVIGCKVARKGDYIHMAFVFHKITSCTECAICEYCVNCEISWNSNLKNTNFMEKILILKDGGFILLWRRVKNLSNDLAFTYKL